MTLKEQREKLAELARTIRRMADTLNREQRDFTSDEKAQWDSLNREFDTLGRQIEVTRRADDIDALVSSRPDSFGPIPGREDYDSRAAEEARQVDRWGVGFGSHPADDPREVRPLERGESCEQRLLQRSESADQQAIARVGFGRFIRAMVLGPRDPYERRALEEGSGPAGGYTVPSILSARLIDRLRARATVMRAGAQIVPLTSDQNSFARIASDPTPVWRGEGQSVEISDPTFEKITLRPRSLGMLVKVSRELLDDSININQALETCFANAMALEMDRVALLGAGVAEPLGVFNFPNVNVVEMGVNGAPLTNYDKMLDLLRELADANANTPTAAIMAPRTYFTLAKLKDGENRPLEVPPALRNIPFMETTQIPTDQTHGTATDASSIIMGDFNDLWIGVRTQLQIEILKERYADNLQYGFLAWMRVDVHAQHDESFGKLVGITP